MAATGNKAKPLTSVLSSLQLDEHAVPGLVDLSAAQQKRLVDTVHAVQSAQRVELAAAIEAALRHVPLLLRRPVLKILRG
ncbi:MAG: hypothetical protein EPN72_11480 [Nevskiaceae bacterium]|nr:MAG: hypothetical protein EPN63_01500 [Nevskiaceae bacterium]TBR71817.1 MAG: hypothetical protein EPN72_11480 [Nevskiaceae bacterium]